MHLGASTHQPFGQSVWINKRCQVQRFTGIAELRGHRDAMNRDVGRSERSPGVVRVAAEQASKLFGDLQSSPRLSTVRATGGNHRREFMPSDFVYTSCRSLLKRLFGPAMRLRRSGCSYEVVYQESGTSAVALTISKILIRR
jgi:hypothetical protein